MRTVVCRPVCALSTTAGGLGALDFHFKLASLHIQWMRLPLDNPSKWRHFAKFWLDRAPSTFVLEVLTCLNVPVSGIPISKIPS